jgi:tetratricopeptide (TPR) repeat protein
LSTPGLDEVRRQFPESWQDAVRDAWVAEQYFFVLLWKGQPAAAQQFARRMVDRYQSLGISKSKWLERMGDAAFFQNNFSEALDYYESSLKESDNAGTLVKVSDVYFRLGDFEKERLYREKIYGSLRQK